MSTALVTPPILMTAEEYARRPDPGYPEADRAREDCALVPARSTSWSDLRQGGPRSSATSPKSMTSVMS